MKRSIILPIFVCLLGTMAFAQSNFSGEWVADTKRSRFDDKNVEHVSMALKVTHTANEIKWYRSANVRQIESPFEISERSGSDSYSLDRLPHDNHLYPTLKVTNTGVFEGAKITIKKQYERRNGMSSEIESRTTTFFILELIEQGKTLKMSGIHEGEAKAFEELYFARK